MGEDAAFFLFLVPIVASIVYGVYEWYMIGRGSYSMPNDAYLIVSKDPYLFILSLAAVCAAIVIEVRSSTPGERANVVSAIVAKLQGLAIVVLIISFAAGLSVAGYGDVAGGLANFLTGRFALIYAFFLLVISILISSRQFLRSVGAAFITEFIGLLLIGLSPVVLYGGYKVHLSFTISIIAALGVLTIGLLLLASRGMAFTRGKSKQKPVAA